MKNDYNCIKNFHSTNIMIILKSMLVGVLSSLVICGYRVILNYCEQTSFKMYSFLRENLLWFPVFILGAIIISLIVGFLVYKNDMISGSGIPQVKGILMGYFKNNWVTTLVFKFIGGSLAILAGLSLGREGPSIQLGATVAEGIGKKTIKTNRMERKILIASGASAGLAAAFNAPLAGVIFALEEVFKYFSPVILLSTMSSAIVADFISKQFFGIGPIFNFAVSSSIPLNNYWILVLMGGVLGLCGAAYNKGLVFVQNLYKKIPFLNKLTRPMIPFLLAVLLGVFCPYVLGGGHELISFLTPETTVLVIFALLIIKFMFSAISFGSGVPGGIFFPLLIMGGMIGVIFANISINYFGVSSELFNNFIILAMAGYFTAIVKAPITGIVLITEMTNSLHHLLPLSVVAIVAYIITDFINSKPIYDTLLENQLKDKELIEDVSENNKKIMIDAIIHIGSSLHNKKVKEVLWPKHCLLVAIKRRETEIIPKGETQLKLGDYILVMTDINHEWKVREELNKLTEA